MKMKRLKSSISKLLNFCCMFVLLGIQSLLHGSWTVADTKPISTEGVFEK